MVEVDEFLKLSMLPAGKFWKVLWRYYLHRNRELLAVRHSYQVSILGGNECFPFETYLKLYRSELHRHHSGILSFLPDVIVQNVGAHTRRGHTRYTSRGPVEVRSHNVSGHTRVRNRR